MAQAAAYELAVIYQVGNQEAPAKVADLLKQAGGQISRETAWEERDLAYPIKRQPRGIYIFYELDIPADAIGRLETSLNITAGVLRHLITRIDHKAKSRAEAVSQRQAERQPTTAGKPAGETADSKAN